MRPIDVDALPIKFWGDRFVVVSKVDIENAPTVDAVKHGHWITITDEPFADKYKCSECDKEPLIADGEFQLTPYCPFCGAKMDEVKDEIG